MRAGYIRRLKNGTAYLHKIEDPDRDFNEDENNMSNKFVEVLKKKLSTKPPELSDPLYVRYLIKKEKTRASAYITKNNERNGTNRNIDKYKHLLVSVFNMSDEQIMNFLKNIGYKNENKNKN